MEEISLIPKLRFPEFKDELSTVKLGSIASFSKGKGISKSQVDRDGVLECIRYGELYTEYSEVIDKVVSKTNVSAKELVLSSANDVIIPASGETQIDIATASCVLREGVALGGDLNIIKSPVNGVYLAYYLNNAKKSEIASLSQGISVVHLYASQLKSLLLNLHPQEEQQKIATFLTAVDERIQLLRDKKTKLEAYKKGVMQKLFSQEIRFKDENGNPFPDWELKKLGEIFERITKKNKENNQNVLTISAQKGLVNQLEYFNNSVSGKDLTKYYLLKKGDFAYNRSYSKGYPMGATKVLKFYEKGVVSTLYICFRRKSNEINIDFMEHLFDSGILNKNLYKIVQEGARNHGLLNLSLSDFFDISINMPILQEQQKIAAFLSSIDESIEAVSSETEGTTTFKKGLLQKMFV